MAGGLRWTFATVAGLLPVAACSLATDLGGFSSAASQAPDPAPEEAGAPDGPTVVATSDANDADGVFCRPGLTGPTCTTPCPPRTAGASCAFRRVFRLEIPIDAKWNVAADVPYAENASSTAGAFTRVAYRLVLDDEEVWVELDPFTPDASRLGVPVDWVFQEPIANVIVRSFSDNQEDVLVPTTGNMEFWSHCYSEGGDGRFDHADDRGEPADCYGSMQLHVGERPVLSFNRWSQSDPELDLGIGPSPTPTRPDWTFAKNSRTFTTRLLEVYVR
ncbi:MAG: hypothetical protein KF795_22690 [Labilithrix sp.]|nr:hypothetical protein [Labilithrix sp.]